MLPAPTAGVINHAFREKRSYGLHNGIDYKADPGTPVKASLGGMVYRSIYHEPREVLLTFRWNDNVNKERKFTGSYGNVIIIYHGLDVWSLMHTYTLYAHLEKRSVKKDDLVNQNQLIGTIGNSGTREGFYNKKGGYKLHFEALQSNVKLKWVSSGPLDHRSTSETWRIDPEKFLSRSAGGFAARNRAVYTVTMPNGITITCGMDAVIRRDKAGNVLNRVKRSALEDSGLWPFLMKLLDDLGIGFGTVGPIAGSGNPLNANDWTHPGQRKFADGEISGAVYNYMHKAINPKGVDRKGQFISSPFAEALREDDNPNIKKMNLLELFDEIFK